jgi:rhodanese-related sulfurtransferase
MRRTLITLLLAALALPLAAEKKLTPDELKDALESKDKSKIFLLDVRNPEELEQTGVIDGYVNIPLPQLEKRLSEVPKNRTIITMCMRGNRAGQAAAILEKAGYEVFGSCGIVPYKDKGYETKPYKK